MPFPVATVSSTLAERMTCFQLGMIILMPAEMYDLTNLIHPLLHALSCGGVDDDGDGDGDR